MTAHLTTADLLLRWDQRRPRSQQVEVGMSELGGCRRQVGYRLAGTKPTNASSSVQAVLGTAIHAAVETVFRELQADGAIPPEDLVEHRVTFAGIPGTVDRYVAAAATVEDTKTTSSRWLEHIKVHGPSRSHLWQVSCYGAALIHEGKRVRRLVINYIARDTGEEWRWEGPFDPGTVKEALAWLTDVRSTELDMLPREYLPDSPFCRHCAFSDLCWDGGVEGRAPASVLYVENPDGAKWAQQLKDAREAKAAAEAREKEAKEALDAIRPNEDGRALVEVPGFPLALQWQVSVSNRLDTDAVKAEYRRTGAEPPMKSSTSVTLKLAPLPDKDGSPDEPPPPAKKPARVKKPAPALQSVATEPALPPEGPATRAQITALNSAAVAFGIAAADTRAAFLTRETGRPVERPDDLTAAEARALLARIHDGAITPPTGDAA